MRRKEAITAVVVVALAAAAVVAAGVTMADSVHTPNVSPEIDPGEDQPVPDEEDSDATDDGPRLEIDVDEPDGGVVGDDPATITVTALDEEDAPVEGVDVVFSTLGAAGSWEWDPGTELETDSDGQASVEWYFTPPEEETEFSAKPPSESTTITVEATVAGEELQEFVSVGIDFQPYRDGCHSEGDNIRD